MTTIPGDLAHERATALSFAGQPESWLIPAENLDTTFIRSGLAFQPLGTASRMSEAGQQIAWTDYFAPAVCVATVTQEDSGLRVQEHWINGAQSGGYSIRLFPHLMRPGDANRAQTVNFGPDETVWVSRNSDRAFFVFAPQGAAWVLTSLIQLPESGPESRMESALLDGDKLFTVEATGDLKSWIVKEYRLEGNQISHVAGSTTIPEWVYGIGRRPGDGGLWYVTDVRSPAPPGLYRADDIQSPLELVVPGIEGSGIAFLEDGSAFVSVYGQGYPEPSKGRAGAFCYVPSSSF